MTLTLLLACLLGCDLGEISAVLAQQRDQVRTLYCEFEQREGNQISQCLYAMEGAVIRGRVERPGVLIDVWTNGVVIHRYSNRDGNRFRSIGDGPKSLGAADARVWTLMMVRRLVIDPKGVIGRNLEMHDTLLPDLLPPTTKLKSLTREADRQLTTLVLSHPGGMQTWTIELDERRNYQPRRLVTDALTSPPLKPRRDRSELLVEEFQEVQPGLWFPVRVVQRVQIGDVAVGERFIHFTKVSVNAPLPASA